MRPLADELRALRPIFTACAGPALADYAPLTAVAAPEFYDALMLAVETESLGPLHTLADMWVKNLPIEPATANLPQMAALQALRQCLWETLAAHLEATEAMRAVITLEHFFAGMSLRLAVAQLEARLRLMEAEVEVARSELTRLDKSKSDFIAVAAHELKTPLTLIEGYAQLLGNEFPENQQTRVSVLLQGLGNGTRRLKEIIDEMIDVSLIDTNLLALHYAPVDVGALVQAGAREWQAAARQRRLALTVEVLESELVTYADGGRLRQVLAQVLENAIKFTPDGGRITLSARRLEGYVEIAITDTGIGIAPADLARIFDPFSVLGDVSLHSSGKTKFKGGGPGLGLPIARGLIRAHGGRLWVESAGRDEAQLPGTTVFIMLPIRTQPPPEIREPQLLMWAKDPKPWRQLAADDPLSETTTNPSVASQDPVN